MSRIFVIILGAVLLTGCESMPFERFSSMFSLQAIDPETDQSAVVELQPESLLSDQLNEFVATAKNGDIATIAVSPWSTNHDIMAQEYYYSGTGRKCRTLRLLHGIKGLPRKQHVCEQVPGTWVPLRCITR